MEIIAVLGKVCSGKDTFAEKHVNHTQIDIGSIVRRLMNEEKRVHKEDLDLDIIAELRHIFTKSQDEKFIVTGIRQMSILIELFGQCSNTQVIWLEVPDTELKRRFINRESDKDKSLSFEEILRKDGMLGLDDLEIYVKRLPYTKIINNY